MSGSGFDGSQPYAARIRANGPEASFVKKKAQFPFSAISLGLRGKASRMNPFRGSKHKTLVPNVCLIQNINIINHKKFLNRINSMTETNVYCSILFTFV